MRSHAKAATAGSTQGQAMGRQPVALFAALLLTALIALTTSVALGADSSERLRSFGPDGTEASDFERVNSVAVDQQSGAVYVLDALAGSLYKFDATGQPVNWGGSAPYITDNRIEGISVFEEPSEPNTDSQLAVDSTSHVVYVTEEHSLRAFQANGEPAEFTAGPGKDTGEISGFGALTGVAVDVNGAIYAADRTGGVSVYASSGAPLTTVTFFEAANLAVASDGTLYVVPEFSTKVERLTPDTFPVSGATTYTVGTPVQSGQGNWIVAGAGVDPLIDDLYLLVTNFNFSWIRKHDESGAFLGSIGEPGTPGEDEALGSLAQGMAIIGGGKEISAGETIHFYVGDTKGDFSKVAIFGTEIVIGPPSVESTSVTDVAADSATLHAEINPNTFETTYRFEYGLEDCAISACVSVPLGGTTIPAGHEPVAVAQEISGLQAGTTYHYRVVAENSESVTATEGPDHTFTTQVSGLGFELADNRAWEMVSPPSKLGGRLTVTGPIQAAENGQGLVYFSFGPIEADVEGNRALEQSTVLARRGAEGWRSKDITPPNDQAAPFANLNSEYKLFSPDLSRAMLQRRSHTSLSPQASERTPYLRENTEPPTYTPLVTGKEGFANVPPGTEFGGGGFEGAVKLAGATSDLSHIVLSSPVPLATGAPASENSLYEWTAGQLEPVSVLPAGEGGGIVSSPAPGSGFGPAQHLISEDGSRVFWGTGEYNVGGNTKTALYVRDTLADQTVRLDVPQPGASEAGTARPVFQGASADGTVVFFTDSRQLTAGASPDEWDLYRCVIPAGSPASGCATLTDISAPLAGSGESTEVQGIVSAISEDGSRAYFVAKGVLDTAPNEAGDSAVSGEPNLYLWQQGEGARFIAILAGDDEPVWGGDGPLVPGQSFFLNATASPEGRYFSFMSQRGLSGYDNRDATSGEPLQEVYRYDALADRLVCVSCNPSGARPSGLPRAVGDAESLVDPRGLWNGSLAAILPQAPPNLNAIQEGVVPRRYRSVLDNGRVFFNAADSLVPADSNGQWDVYQWEPVGVGDCRASSGGASIARAAGGCVSLLSSGTAEKQAGFLDAGATGDDVFFLTESKLSVTDEDSELDVYDARVDGVPAKLAPNTECLGEACQPAAVVPNDPTPTSASFKGQGNPKPNARKRCAKGKRAVRRNGKARCVARKQHKRAGKAKRAGKSGRASR